MVCISDLYSLWLFYLSVLCFLCFFKHLSSIAPPNFVTTTLLAAGWQLTGGYVKGDNEGSNKLLFSNKGVFLGGIHWGRPNCFFIKPQVITRPRKKVPKIVMTLGILMWWRPVSSGNRWFTNFMINYSLPSPLALLHYVEIDVLLFQGTRQPPLRNSGGNCLKNWAVWESCILKLGIRFLICWVSLSIR